MMGLFASGKCCFLRKDLGGEFLGSWEDIGFKRTPRPHQDWKARVS
jgi:hypothetical protein